MNRRDFISFSILSVSSFCLNSCTNNPKTGPLEIKYDRDKCAECGMAVSDQRFAAQIRGGSDHDYSAHKFDDIGCAMKFARKQLWMKDSKTEFYVIDYDSKKWLNARTAAYKKIKNSPMGYGFAALEKGNSETVDYGTVDLAIGE